MLWRVNREQFYEFLLLNCGFELSSVRKHPHFRGNYQDYLYDVAIQQIEESMPENLDLDHLDLEKKMDFINASILEQEFSESSKPKENAVFPLVLPKGGVSSKKESLKTRV